jgi:hypothetical protein
VVQEHLVKETVAAHLTITKLTNGLAAEAVVLGQAEVTLILVAQLAVLEVLGYQVQSLVHQFIMLVAAEAGLQQPAVLVVLVVVVLPIVMAQLILVAVLVAHKELEALALLSLLTLVHRKPQVER